MIPLETGKLESVERLTRHPGWEALKEFADQKIARVEKSLTRLLFTSAAPVDPLRVEYDRGFRQGVKWILEAAPVEAQVAYKKAIAEKDGE